MCHTCLRACVRMRRHVRMCAHAPVGSDTARLENALEGAEERNIDDERVWPRGSLKCQTPSPAIIMPFVRVGYAMGIANYMTVIGFGNPQVATGQYPTMLLNYCNI